MASDPTDLRALSARVLAEEPSDELRNAVLVALGWEMDIEPLAAGLLPLMQSPAGHVTSLPPNPLTSHDAAFGAMPAGWTIYLFQHPTGWHVQLYDQSGYGRWATMDPVADLPRAVTAAGLLARAVEMEAAHDQ